MTDAELNALISTLPPAYLPVVEAYIQADWKTYERLDPDRAILRAAYAVAPREVRKLLGSSGRQGGRTEIVEILATNQTSPPKPHIPATPTDADILFETLTAQKRYDDLWNLAQNGTPLLSARILVWLAANNWQPETSEDRAVFPHLVKRARACADLSPQYGLMYKKRCINFYRSGGYNDNVTISRDGKLLMKRRETSLIVYQIPEKKYLRSIQFLLIGSYISAHDRIYLNENTETLVWHERHLYGTALHVMDVKSQKLLKMLTGYADNPSLFVGNRLLLTKNYHTPQTRGLFPLLYDLETGKESEPFEGPIPNSGTKLVVSPNGQILAICFNWSLWFWSVETGQKLLEVPSDMHLNLDGAFTFSPDSTQVVISGYAGRVHFLDLKSGKLVRQLDTPNGGTLSLAFSPDGKFLAVGSNEQNISLYNLETGQLVQNMLRHGKRVDQVAFRDDGMVVSASKNGLVCIWASRLTELCERPIEQNELQILRWIARQLDRPDLTTAERIWLEFAQAILHLRWRYAVEIETDVTYKTHAAPTDIEL